jgi:hypothetical protein
VRTERSDPFLTETIAFFAGRFSALEAFDRLVRARLSNSDQGENCMSNEATKTISQELKEVIVDDRRPIDQKVPGSAFAVVSLSYLLLLAAAMAGMGVGVWLY